MSISMDSVLKFIISLCESVISIFNTFSTSLNDIIHSFNIPFDIPFIGSWSLGVFLFGAGIMLFIILHILDAFNFLT